MQVQPDPMLGPLKTAAPPPTQTQRAPPPCLLRVVCAVEEAGDIGALGEPRLFAGAGLQQVGSGGGDSSLGFASRSHQYRGHPLMRSRLVAAHLGTHRTPAVVGRKGALSLTRTLGMVDG